jgi:hypothetical protein
MKTLSKQEKNGESLPDPWEMPVSNFKNNLVSNSVKLMEETERFLPVTKEQKILQPTNYQLSSIQIIIEDWLKIKTQITQKITDRIQEAIALLLLLSGKSQLL